MTEVYKCKKCNKSIEAELENGKPKIRRFRTGFVGVFLKCGHISRPKDKVNAD